MGKLRSGPHGKITGKIGGIVYQLWLGYNTAREFVMPGNPRTPKQVFQRDRMSYVGVFCGLLKDMAVRMFWKQYQKNTTALSECSRSNINLQPPFVEEGVPFVPAPLNRISSRGNLEAAPAQPPNTYDAITGLLVVNWGSTVIGNGSSTDKAYVQIVDQESLVSLANDTVTRADEGVVLNIGAGRNAFKINVFVTMYRDLTTGIFNSLGAAWEVGEA